MIQIQIIILWSLNLPVKAKFDSVSLILCMAKQGVCIRAVPDPFSPQ